MMMRKEKARSRKRMWKEWRWNEEENDENDGTDKSKEDEQKNEAKQIATLPGEEARDIPRQGNSPPKPDKPLKVGGELGGGGAYEKIGEKASLTESTAPCKLALMTTRERSRMKRKSRL